MGCIIKYKRQSIPEEQFLQYLNKQIAINNLFNENGNLANSVYEALGFDKQINEIADTKKVDEFIKKYKDALPNIKDGKTLISHLQTISNRNSGTTKKFADLIIKLSEQNISLSKLLNNPNLYAKPDGVGDEGAFHWSLFNNLSVNKIVIELNHFKTNTYDDVFLHELIHNLTTQFIVKDSDLFNQIFYNKVKELYSVFDNYLENNRKVNELLFKSTKEDIKNLKEVFRYFTQLPSDAIQHELIFGKIGSISTVKGAKLDFKSLENRSKQDVLKELEIIISFKESRLQEIEKGDKDYYYFNSKTFKQENVLSEFLATFINDANFRQQIKNIEYKNKKSLFQKIIDLISEFLGLTENDSLYNEFVLTLTNFINNNDYSSIAKQTQKTAYQNRINLLEQQKQQAQQLYSQYLDTIFPDSKVKDIVYHGTNNQDKQEFKKERAGYLDKGFLGKGFYSTYHKNYTKAFGSKTYGLLLNIKNPLLQTNEKIEKFLEKAYKAQELGYDSVFKNFSYDENLTIKDAEEIGAVEYNLPINQSFEQVVFEPEQIHILGSKQDIEGFKEFTKNSSTKGLYLQQSNTKSEQDRIVNKLLDGESRITYNPKDINKDKDNKHSGYSLIDKVTGAVKKITNRVSNIVEELDKNRNFPPRSDSDKAIDDIKKNTGISIHNALNNIAKRFIEGLSGTPATQVDMFGLSPGMYTQLEAQFDNIVKSLPPDTKWLSELKVYDPAEDRAGTIDLIAIDAKGKVHIFDFKSIDLYGKETIPKNKKENWNVQITAYKRILSKVYGVKDFGMLRAIPIQTNYKMVNKVLTLWSVKVANKDLSLEKDERLLPVPISGMAGADIERTGDEKTDALIDRLVGQLDRIIKKTEYEDEAKIRKVERILELNKAIRDLQVFHDIKSFIDGASYEVQRLQSIDLRKLDEQEIGNAANLLEFYSTLKSEGVISEVQKAKYADRLMKMIDVSQELLYEVRKVQKEIVLRLGTNEGNSDILTATPETSLWGRLFRSASQSTHPIINTLYKLVMKQRDKTYTRIMEIQDKISTLHDKLVEWGNSNGLQGLDVFKPLLQYDEKGEWTGRLANKFSKKFRDLKEKAISEKDVEWILANTTFNKEKYEEVLANNVKYWKNVFAGRPNMDEEVEKRVQSFRRQFDPTLKSAVLNKKNWYLQPTSKWESEEMKYIKSHPALLNYYNYFTELMKEYHSYLEFDFYGNFVPNIENSLLQQIWDGGLNSYIGLNMSHVFDAKSDGMIGMVDERGEVTHEIPAYFTREIDPNIKSRDLTKSLLIFSQMALNNKHMQEIESSALLLKEAISNAPSLLTDAAGKPIMNKLTHKLAKVAKSSNDIEQFNNYLLDYMYGIKTDGKDYIFDNGASGKRVFSTVMSTFSVTKLSLNMFTAFANGVGGTANGFFEGARGRFYNNQQFSKAFANMVSRDSKTVLLSHFFDIDSNESTFKKAERLSASSVLKNFTFDKFHILQRSGDYVVENMVLGAMLQSHTIDNGKIRKKKEGERSLYELSEIVDDRIVIPGLQAEEFGKFRRKVKYLYSELKGNNNPDDISQIRRTIFGQALMQFRNWIPRMADERLGNLRYTSDLEVWEEGKFRTFLSHVTRNVLTNIPSALFANGIVGIGKHSMDETLTKAADYEWERMFAKNPNLKITKEEYREVYIGNIRATIAELQTVLALVILLVVAKPNGDDGKDSKRRLFLRLAKRTMNELSFWIDPDANMSILKTPIPVVGIVNDTGALLSSVFKASWYKATGDQDKYDKIYVTRDFFRLFPIASSIETTYSTISPRKR